METKKYFHARPIFYCFLALLLGVSATKFLFECDVKIILLIVIAFGLLAAYCVFKKRFLSLFLIFLTFLFGIGWYFVGISTFYGKTYTEQVSVVGRVSDDFEFENNYTTCVLKNVYIDGEKAKNISLSVKDNAAELKIGDVIAFSAEISTAKLFELGNFNSFYYRDKTPYKCQINYDGITLRAQNDLLAVERFRQKVKSTLASSMGQQNGAVAYAILFGDKTDIDGITYSAYKSSGVIHLLTVSGLHVSFLFALLGFILKRLKVKGWLNLLICGVLLFLYAYACNFTPSILRAGIMGLVLIFTKFSGKCYDSLNSIGLAGILITLIFPLSPLDVGFLMSFFCVLSIAIIFPWLSKILQNVFPKFVADAFAVSVGVEIAIFPFLSMIYSSFNLLSFFINLIVIPIFSVLYPLLFISTFVCLLLPFMAFLLKVCGFGLDVIFMVVSFFGGTSFVLNLKPLDTLCTMFAFIGLYLLGRNFMASKKVKAVCCSTLFALSGLCYGLSFVPLQNQTSLSYCYSYSQSLVVLTNSSGATVCVDLPKISQKTFERLKVKNVAATFVLQNSTYDFELSRQLDIANAITYKNSLGYSEEISNATQGVVAGFSYSYILDGDVLLGLELNFDDKAVFILKDQNISAKALDILTQKDYNVVLLGRQDYGEHFARNVTVLSYYNSPNSNYSFQRDGNIQIFLKNNKRRFLD